MQGTNNTETDKGSGENITGDYISTPEAVPESRDYMQLYDPKTLARADTGMCPLKHHLPVWLPKYTSLGFLHAPIKSSGLGIPSLGTTIPIHQKNDLRDC